MAEVVMLHVPESQDQDFTFDHIAIPVGKGNLEPSYAFFTKFLGAKLIYNPGTIGDGKTFMKTIVVRLGSVDLALMEGVDGPMNRKSQISFYEDGTGQGPWGHQHFAIACKDLKKLTDGLHKKGVRFLTENEDETPKILYDEDSAGGAVLQAFTYPILNGRFFEFKQKIKEEELKHFEQFRDNNVKELWRAVDKKVGELGWEDFCRLNIFGEWRSLAASLEARGIYTDWSLCEKYTV